MKQTPSKTTRLAERRLRNQRAKAARLARERGWAVEVKPSGEVILHR